MRGLSLYRDTFVSVERQLSLYNKNTYFKYIKPYGWGLWISVFFHNSDTTKSKDVDRVKVENHGLPEVLGGGFTAGI